MIAQLSEEHVEAEALVTSQYDVGISPGGATGTDVHRQPRMIRAGLATYEPGQSMQACSVG